MATRLVATVLAFLPGIALANWIGPFPVRYIESYNGSVFFMLHPDGLQNYTGAGLPSCTHHHTIMFHVTQPAKELDRALSIGLTAQATGKQVKFYITGCNSYLTASGISIAE